LSGGQGCCDLVKILGKERTAQTVLINILIQVVLNRGHVLSCKVGLHFCLKINYILEPRGSPKLGPKSVVVRHRPLSHGFRRDRQLTSLCELVP
jgi:hypothetical protein